MKQLIFWLAMASAFQVAERPRIMIVTDLEGVGGVNNADEQLLPGQRRFEESRRLLAGEVNAAVEGAFKGGAREAVTPRRRPGSKQPRAGRFSASASSVPGRSRVKWS